MAEGSPLGPVLAHSFMCHFEEKLLINTRFCPSLWFRYEKMRGQRDTPSPGLGICQFRLSYFRVAVNSRSAFPFTSETAVDGEIRFVDRDR